MKFTIDSKLYNRKLKHRFGEVSVRFNNRNAKFQNFH